jgi:outer membrane protein assembly factor BamB
MPRALAWIIAVVAVVVVALGGLAVAIAVISPNRTEGALDTELSDVTVTEATVPALPPKPEPEPEPEPTSDKRCWPTFGGDPQRSLARPNATLGLPARRLLWTRGLGSYIEYPPSYCDGTLYVNTFEGDTFAIESETGKVVWRKHVGTEKPSTPAIDGPRLIVSSKDGAVRALTRSTGSVLWTVQTAGKVESSPVVVDGLAYFGSTDGRLFAVQSDSGHVRWAYDTGGRINSSPAVFGSRVCITTYAGSIFCLDRLTGARLWSTYIRRDAFRYESFYATASTDGERLYTVSRSGTVVAVDARNGNVVWRGRVGGYGYTTPAIGVGLVFVGGFDGKLRALRPATGREVWQTQVSGRILGAPVVIGEHVFFSVLEGRTYAARVSDGKVVWKLPMGRYSPGIATERTYFFSLNGRLIAFRGRDAAPG